MDNRRPLACDETMDPDLLTSPAPHSVSPSVTFSARTFRFLHTPDFGTPSPRVLVLSSRPLSPDGPSSSLVEAMRADREHPTPPPLEDYESMERRNQIIPKNRELAAETILIDSSESTMDHDECKTVKPIVEARRASHRPRLPQLKLKPLPGIKIIEYGVQPELEIGMEIPRSSGDGPALRDNYISESPAAARASRKRIASNDNDEEYLPYKRQRYAR